MTMYRRPEQPKLFAIVPAPEGFAWVMVNEWNGDIAFSPIKWVGKSNFESPWDRSSPYTTSWYQSPYNSNRWLDGTAHGPAGRPSGNTCRCREPKCIVLGISGTSEVDASWLAEGKVRSEGLQKRTAAKARQKEYAREYQRKLKEKRANDTPKQRGSDVADGRIIIDDRGVAWIKTKPA